MRDLTQEEQEAIANGLIKISKPTGVNLFDLLEREKISLERNYVIVCNEHKGIGGALLFWGSKTEDNAIKRSFGGYTSDFNACEKYTLEDIQNSGYKSIPIYGKGCNHDNYREFEDFAIEISRLKILGYRPMLIYYR